ncbi:hypothetical protein ACEWY4_001911 [Coilia grayii]|uniref:Calcineurin-like phosphoesterase domain-containing protein n=1 Tax=Coilia grayii TaxID=363190 RepID=A0ABD1KUB5_9TELE
MRRKVSSECFGGGRAGTGCGHCVPAGCQRGGQDSEDEGPPWVWSSTTNSTTTTNATPAATTSSTSSTALTSTTTTNQSQSSEQQQLLPCSALLQRKAADVRSGLPSGGRSPGVAMAFTLSEIMAARRQQQQQQQQRGGGARAAGGGGVVEVDEYSANPTQAFTFYNINQGRFQPPHVHMVDPLPHDTPKPPGYTRFVCISDTHSRTDAIHMPYGDVFIHAGDFTELGLPSEVKKFNDWLGTLPYDIKIVIAGNHELTFDQEFMADLIKQDFYYFPSASKLKPENYENVQSLLTNCIYLQDSEVTVRGFHIYGSPCSSGPGPAWLRAMPASLSLSLSLPPSLPLSAPGLGPAIPILPPSLPPSIPPSILPSIRPSVTVIRPS